jgi:hypothetical protein
MALFAELHVLGLVHPTGPVDISTWRGPLREPHDIVLPDRAVEVKAIGPGSEHIRIHGIEQLEPPGRPLALVLITLASTGIDGETLPDVVDRVLGRVSDRVEAISRLASAGYSPTDRDAYPTQFSVLLLECIVVGTQTPRIVSSSLASGILPEGVDRVAYRLELAQLRPAAAVGQTALRQWAGTA